VWIATTGHNTGLLRRERATDSVRDQTPETHVTPQTNFTSFREDRAGNIWIGTSETGGLRRYSEGAFRRFTVADGVPPGWIIDLHLDLSGRLRVARRLGDLNRIDDPSAAAHLTRSISFVNHSRARWYTRG
jgi:ligand-binding sensor domain-containing protein